MLYAYVLVDWTAFIIAKMSFLPTGSISLASSSYVRLIGFKRMLRRSSGYPAGEVESCARISW